MAEKLFSIQADQFELQFFRAGGAGGQKQNKTSSACRVIHRASGAVGECREERHQHENRKRAFHRCVESERFKAWLKIEVARVTGQLAQVEVAVGLAMQRDNILVEIKRSNGTWKKEEAE